MVNKTITQTRQGLIFSDMAFFIVDAREGINYTDIKLANWINKAREIDKNPAKIFENNETQEKTAEPIENFESIPEYDETTTENSPPPVKIIKNNDFILKKEDFYQKLKKMKEGDEVTIPKIILIANKAENNFYAADVFNEYTKLKMGEPILISAANGDNMQDIYNAIEENIPQSFKDTYSNKVVKRISRYLEYKEKLKNDFLEALEKLNPEEREKYSIKEWEEDFDFLNKKDLEDNSDYDSDNDIDPIDSFVKVPKTVELRKDMKISTSHTKKRKQDENKEEKSRGSVPQQNPSHNQINSLKNLKKPIKIAIIGKQNVGKSSIINSLLRENRVIISNVPGTTRDSIPIQWVYKGRRMILIDTAGMQAKNKVHEKVFF